MRHVLAVLGVILLSVLGFGLILHAALGSVSSGIGSEPEPSATYGFPSPSYWPESPYPLGSMRPEQPVPTVSPCPTWAPTLVRHQDGTYECRATIPTDPGTGPILTCPDPRYPIKNPSGIDPVTGAKDVYCLPAS